MRIRTLFGFLPPRLLYSQQEFSLEEFPLPEKATVLIDKKICSLNDLDLKTGDSLSTGQEIKSADGRVLAVSTVTGEVSQISSLNWVSGEEYITVEIVTSSAEEFASKSIGDYQSQNKDELLKLFNNAGYLKDWQGQGSDTVVINCFENDLIVSNRMPLLKNEKDKLKKGIDILRYMSGASRIILAVPLNLKSCVEFLTGENCEIAVMKPRYPLGNPEYLKLKLKINERSEVVKAEDAAGIAEFAESGKPRIDKILTVIDKGGNAVKNLRVRIGTPVENILKSENMSLEKKERLVLGGPMKGRSVFNYSFPVTADTDAVFLQGLKDIHEISNLSCFNCGKCVRACPYRLQVNLISRYSEYSLFEKCEDYEIDSCIECGLCSYVCVSRRPLVQYIKFARGEIEKMKEVQ